MLEVRDLKKVYRPKKGQPVRALDGVSLTFPDRGLVFVLGKSGSGKSTLLHVMGGLDTADSGEIIIKGKSSSDFSQGDFDSYRNTYVGFIFQEYNVLDEFTVAANIGLALELQGLKATDARVGELLQEVGLQGLGDRKPNELSGGQKQRVAIARALIKNPEIIMADEPTGALDSNTGRQVFDTLKELSKTRLVIVVSHDREFAEQFGDRVIELADGKVIGDITKTRIADDTQADVSVVNDKFIRIRRGKLLTEKDLAMINEYLKGKKTDTVIPIEPKAEEETKKLLHAEDGAGASEVFVATTSDLIKHEKGELKLIKSRLPFKNALKMGASGLKHKRVRLAFSIILASLAFSFFGFADTVAAYDKNAVAYQSMKDVGVNYLYLTKMEYDDKNSYPNRPMSKADIASLSETYGVTFRPVYDGDRGNLDFRNNLNAQESVRIYPSEFGGATAITQDFLDKSGFVLDGELPESGEVVVTEWVFQSFKKFGYKSFDPVNMIQNIETIEKHGDLIGKTLEFGDRQVRVSGILDTELELAPYADILGKDTDDIYADPDLTALYREFTLQTDGGYHQMLFIPEEEETDYIFRNMDVNFDFSSEKGDFSCSSLFGFTEAAADWKFVREDATTLADDEIAISSSLLYDRLGVEEEKTRYFEEYAQANFSEELKDYGIMASWEYGSRLMSEWYESAPLGRSGREVEEMFLREFCGSLTLQMSGTVMLANNMINVGETFRIGAFTLDREDKFFDPFFPETFLNKINGGAIYSAVIAPNTASADALRGILREHYAAEERQEGVHYSLDNSVTRTLRDFNDLIEILADVFLYVGIAFAVFAALLFTNFISTSVAFKRREIGILRAVGARSKDVFMIFFCESLIVALIDFVLATVLTAVLVPLASNMIRSGLNLTLLIFGVRQAGLILGLSLLVAFVASFFPVRRIARKKPIDAIRDK